jgi:hypothetical protein
MNTKKVILEKPADIAPPTSEEYNSGISYVEQDDETRKERMKKRNFNPGVSVNRLGRRRKSIKKLSKELKKQQKEHYIPKAINYDDIDLAGLLGNNVDNPAPESFTKQIPIDKRTKNNLQREQQLYEEQSFIRKQAEIDYHDFQNDMDLSNISDVKDLRVISGKTMEGFGKFMKEDDSKTPEPKKKTSTTKPKPVVMTKDQQKKEMAKHIKRLEEDEKIKKTKK